MKIHYTMLRPDLGKFHTLDCDNFKSETHPVTGKFTLHLQETVGVETRNTAFISGVVMFRVER